AGMDQIAREIFEEVHRDRGRHRQNEGLNAEHPNGGFPDRQEHRYVESNAKLFASYAHLLPPAVSASVSISCSLWTRSAAFALKRSSGSRGRGRSISTISWMRPGLAVMMITRSERNTASEMLCVTNMTVLRSSLHILRSSMFILP